MSEFTTRNSPLKQHAKNIQVLQVVTSEMDPWKCEWENRGGAENVTSIWGSSIERSRLEEAGTNMMEFAGND